MPSVIRSSVRRALPVFLLGLALAGVLRPGHGFGQSLADPQLVAFPGGILETPTTALLRPRLSQVAIQAFLPARGPFTFPAPYNTGGIRLTNAGDCGGSDCVNYVGYSYYRNINNHVGRNEMLIFLGLNQARGGPGPTLFSYDKTTDQVTKVGPLFDPSSGKSWHSGEGWYFSGTQPTTIYINDGPRMQRYDVLTRQTRTVFDVSARYGADKYIWQMHSSDDDRVHSATLRSTPSYEELGCVVYHEDTGQFQFFPKIGTFDECHVDKSGRWLMSLEDVDGLYGTEMRIFDLSTGAERLVWDQNGAPGHADMGHGYVVGCDNWNPQPNTILFWDFAADPLSGRSVFHSPDWLAPASNHIAHGNARPDLPPDRQYACGSMASRANSVWGDEIVCFRLDGSPDVLVVAPVMTDMDAPGGGDDYSKMPKGNLDVTGQYFIWTSNTGGSRLDAFIAKVPAQLLMGSSADTAPPSVTLTAPAPGSTLSGTVTVGAGASDDVGVAGVQFRLDGAALGAEDTAAPYATSWNTAGANGPHALTAVARDAAGHVATSAPVAVTVVNDAIPPGVLSVLASGISTSGATITWTTGEPADTQVEYGTTTAYGSLTSLDTALVTSHARTLAGLAAGTLHHYRVRSRDAAGNLATSGDYSFTTQAQDPPTTGTGPRAVWPLNEGAGTVAGDGSGNGFAGTLVNGAAWVPGVQGTALSFDGTDDYVNVPNGTALNLYPLSVTFWARTGATGLHGIVNKYLPGSRNGYQVFVSSGNLCAWYFRDASNYVWDGTGCALLTPGFNDDRWHHVAFVVDAAGGRLYVDGLQRAGRAWTGVPGAASTTASLGFARYPGTAAPYLPGALDDVRIYDRALAAGEVTTLAAPPDTEPPLFTAVAATNLTPLEATIAWTTSEPADSQVEYGTTAAYGAATTLDAATVVEHSQVLSGLSPGTLYYYRVKSRDGSGNLAVSGDFTFTTPAEDPPPHDGKKRRPVAHWKLNEGSGPLGADASGGGFAGTLVNGPAWTAGVLGGALSFDGVDDAVDVSHAAALNPYPMSLVLWLRTGATGLHGIVNKYLPGSRNGYQVFVDSGSLCAWYFRDASDYVWDGTACTLMTPGFNDDRWHHVALVVDDEGGRLYVDGEMRAGHAWSGTPGPVTTTAALGFGRYPGIATPYLPGAIDDVRLYDRALSADEVAGLHAGAAY